MVVAINIAYKVPDDKADEVHGVFKEHFAWMDKFYAGDEGKAFLITCYFSKAKEMNDPMDPSKGGTGNTLFYILEQFADEAAVGRHVENAKGNDYFPKFGAIMGEYGVAVGLGAEIYASIRN